MDKGPFEVSRNSIFYVISQPHLLYIFQDTSERKYSEDCGDCGADCMYFKILYIAASLEIQYIF